MVRKIDQNRQSCAFSRVVNLVRPGHVDIPDFAGLHVQRYFLGFGAQREILLSFQKRDNPQLIGIVHMFRDFGTSLQGANAHAISRTRYALDLIHQRC